MKRMRATSPSAARFISFGSLAMVGMFAMWPSTVLAQVPAPKTGGPEAGDPKSGDPKSGDPKSGDPEAADPKAADPKPEERPSGPPKAGPLPSGPSKEILDRVAALEKEATAISKHKDWLTVADLLEQAYFLVSDPDLAYRIGEAAREGKDCVRAGVYYREFLDAAEFAEPAQVQNAQKRLNQLDTFECPARTPEDDAAMAETLVRHAKQLADEKDFLGSAIEYARATELDPKRPLLAYEVGVASWNAHACSDAVSWFFHFRDLPEAKAHAKEIKQSSKYIDDSELGKCAQWTEQARSDHALLLYEQGQNLEFARDYLGAAGKYERAYEILPSNIVLAFRAAEMSWSAQHCAEAEPYYRAFVADATDARHDKAREKSQSILARIDAHGCPTAMWKTEGGAPIDGGHDEPSTGPGGGGGEQGPPPIEGGGGSTVACSIDDSRSGWGGLSLLVLLGLVRRRRR
jgi:MYXO-CTERM domain-containing protein